MKNNVCHISTVHNRYDVRIFYKECLSLQKNGYCVSLIVADGKGDEKKDDVNIIDIGLNTHGRIYRMIFVTWAAYKKANMLNASIYHFHDPELLLVGLLFKLKCKKVIYDVHEDTAKQILSKGWLPFFLKKVVSLLFNLLEKNMARLFDMIITATSSIEKGFITFNKNCMVVNNYPILEETFATVPWVKKENIVCYVGGITRVRGIEELVNSLDFLECNLLLAGTFSDVKLEERVRQLRGWCKVDYKGFVNREQVYDIFRVSKAGLVVLHPISNYIESLPIKMFEYMSAGIPVIASNFPLWLEIIESNNCGLCVEPGNVEQIANAIDYIIKNDKEAQQMGLNGKKMVLEKYNWNLEEKKLLQVYKKLL